MSINNLIQGLEKISDYWDPHLVASVNDHEVKIAKIKGEFDWHHHPNTDELFLILKGEIRMEMRDEVLELKEGDVYVVKKGIEHRPVAEEEAHILMIEYQDTLNTGNVVSSRTKHQIKSL